MDVQAGTVSRVEMKNQGQTKSSWEAKKMRNGPHSTVTMYQIKGHRVNDIFLNGL